ncbi:peptidylprolyl isomerase [Tanticharoenia sakaeratensis]|uniref:Parvulin-like PPIase n=1 Tax=Tanticharoenia sakaeratensis NBRC 103193 TaxID=1231623 RepID=A0A0D6MHU6_9PROT|nr:peptidylprolyl isomerase [Tanticharoenia sakaeratensis]GAN53076.1 PpiC-type peptidyl-prolyl cis-trans isomerase [Tanticharoenia sakaeratensis NBRC 103193]GBQ19585.1 peptidyl-prolyl cis-trans isomerase [Tanticharoenia sakaeratensis NBRC 103193]
MRLIRPALACAALLSATTLATASLAAPAPAAAPAAPAAAPNPNQPLVSVNGQIITLADVQRAAANLPPQLQNQASPQQLFGILINQLVQQRAVQIAAYKEGLDKQADVHARMQAAADGALQNAYLAQKVTPEVTDAAMQSYYQANYAKAKPEEQVHARHILVASEAQAKDIIAQLNHGADFAKLATQLSTDKGSAGSNGGDLGWFKRGDMLPAFSDAAFKMKPNTITQTPVKTQYGWHVIQVLGTRDAPVPSYDSVKGEIRQKLIQQDVRSAVDAAMKGVKIVQYDQQGKPMATPVQTTTPSAHH